MLPGLGGGTCGIGGATGAEGQSYGLLLGRLEACGCVKDWGESLELLLQAVVFCLMTTCFCWTGSPAGAESGNGGWSCV